MSEDTISHGATQIIVLSLEEPLSNYFKQYLTFMEYLIGCPVQQLLSTVMHS